MPSRVHVWPMLAVLLFSLGGVARASASDQVQVPYQDRVFARIVGAEELSPGEVRLPFEVVIGHATNVGRFTSRGELIVDLATLMFIGTNTLRTAGGERIFIELTGGLTPTAHPEVFVISVETTFVGGTGRFRGATGGFVGHGGLVLGPGGQFMGSTFTGAGDGTISARGGRKPHDRK